MKGDSIVAFTSKQAVCLDPEGRARWRRPLVGASAAIVDDQVVINFDRNGTGGLCVTDLATGEHGREEPIDQGFSAIVDGGFLELGWPEPAVRLRSFARGCPVRWTHSFGAEASAARLDRKSAADTAACFVAVADGDKTRVAALSLETGKEVWAAALREVDEPAADGRWDPAVTQGLLIMGTAGGTVALSLADRRVAWQNRVAALRTVYGDKVYLRGSNPEAPGRPSQIAVLNAKTGKPLWRRDYPEVLKKGRDNRLMGYLAVSETHLFCGDARGAVWAFDARTGEPVWSDRPKGSEAFGPWTLPVAVDGRLFIASAGEKPNLFCHAQARSAKAAAIDEHADPRPDVDFRIEKAHRGQELTGAKPYFASGGASIVLSCRLADESAFFLAVPEAGRSGDGQIWVPSVKDGEGLAKAIRKAFPARGAAAAKGSRVKPPIPVDVAVLGSEVGEAGRGRGTWTFSKWTGEDGSPEFYVNWSLAEARGVIAEKDEGQRKALSKFCAGLVG